MAVAYVNNAGAPLKIGGLDGSFKGTWDNATQYIAGDIVLHNGSTWGASSLPAIADEPGVAGAWAELAASGGGSPRLLGSASITSSQASITSITDVTGLSVTTTVDNTRRYRIETVFRLLTFSSSGARVVRAYMTLADGSDNTLAPVADFQGYASNTGDANGLRLAGTSSYVHEPSSSGSFTYKIRCQTPSGTSTTTVEASSAAPCAIFVWDMGPK